MKSSKVNIRLYGVEHSPWVLGVWYSLLYEDIKTSLSSSPVGIRWHLKNGVTFPVLVINKKKYIGDSFQIYHFLHKNGHTLNLPNNSNQFQKELEKFFLSYSPGRANIGKDFLFFKGWMTMREHPENLAASFSRGFLFLYYYLLIKLALINNLFRSKNFHSQEKIMKHLENFDDKLNKSTWIGGKELTFLDFALFGHIECICSGPTDEIMKLLDNYTYLSIWLKKMILLCEGKEPLYAKRILNKKRKNTIFGKNEFVFTLSFIFWVIIFPITAIFIILLLINRTNSNNYSGALIKS